MRDVHAKLVEDFKKEKRNILPNTLSPRQKLLLEFGRGDIDLKISNKPKTKRQFESKPKVKKDPQPVQVYSDIPSGLVSQYSKAQSDDLRNLIWEQVVYWAEWNYHNNSDTADKIELLRKDFMDKVKKELDNKA